MKVFFKKYLLNGFLLLVPVLLWNLWLYDDLPDSYQAHVFWTHIPRVIAYGENFLRIAIFALPVMMPLLPIERPQKIGLAIYGFGILVYGCSWWAVIQWPNSWWALSAMGFTAPAYTSLIWLIGIGLVGNRTFFNLRNPSIAYIMVSVAFVVFHTTHAYLVYYRL